MSTHPVAWQARHATALDAPTLVERPLVLAVRACAATVAAYGSDHVLREGVVQLLLGTRVLLNAERGRLDGGTLDGALVTLAGRIGFDMDTEEFR